MKMSRYKALFCVVIVRAETVKVNPKDGVLNNWREVCWVQVDQYGARLDESLPVFKAAMPRWKVATRMSLHVSCRASSIDPR